MHVQACVAVRKNYSCQRYHAFIFKYGIRIHKILLSNVKLMALVCGPFDKGLLSIHLTVGPDEKGVLKTHLHRNKELEQFLMDLNG